MEIKENAWNEKYIETTMEVVRQYPIWKDNFDIPSDLEVLVYEDGGVFCFKTGDRICEPGHQSDDLKKEWVKWWKFK